MLKVAALAFVALFAWSAAAEPNNVVVKFKMTWGGIPIADVIDTLEFADGRYKIKSEAVAIGLAKVLNQPPIDRYSEGTYTEDGLMMPERYEYVRDGKTWVSIIDREAGVIRINNEGEEKTEEITTDTIHDNLTLAYIFYGQGDVIANGNFSLTDGRRVTDVDFVRVGEGSGPVETGLGNIDAYQFERVTDRDDRKYLIWFATDHNLLPARYLQRRSNSEIAFILQGVEFSDS